MLKIKKEILVILGVAFVLVVIITANFVMRGKSENQNNSNDVSNVNTDQPSGIPLNDVIKNTPAKVEAGRQYSGRPINEVRLGQGFDAPQSAITQKTKDLNTLAAALNKDPLNINDWIAVGVIKKFFNDFEGARDAWEYATVLYPQDPLAFENLGNLYFLYMHDNVKAEFSYKKALGNNPYEPSFYVALADFYKNTGNKTKVSETILSGMSMIKDVNLILYLASFYRDESDKANAIKYYQEVLKISPNHQGVQEEINRLNNS